MTGVKLEFDGKQASLVISSLKEALDDPAPLLKQINEYLMRIHRQRFTQQKSPQGMPWTPLSPRWQKRKHKNPDKVLTFRGYLRDTLAGVIDSEGLAFGTNRIYGAIHHFGGEIKHRGGLRTLYFKETKGVVGNRFVKKRGSNFAQDVTIQPYTVKIPARPWLGTSAEDDQNILRRTLDYLQKSSSV